MPKLLEQVQNLLRTRHYSLSTEQTYLHWIKQYIFFHGRNIRRKWGLPSLGISDAPRRFPECRRVHSESSPRAICFYRHVLGQELPWLENVTWAKRPTRLPVVLTKDEVKTLLAQLTQQNWLMVSLLYGSGLRLRECLRLRVKDLDFSYNQLVVRNAKGDKDRVTMLPTSLHEPLNAHLSDRETDTRA